MDVRIYYEDTDCGGMVYYANYLKYFERARTQYLEDRGLLVTDLLREGTQFVAVRAELDYRYPARYGEILTIMTRLSAIGNASLTFSHVIREKTHRRIVVEGSTKLVTLDLNGKVKRLDKTMIAALQSAPHGR